MISDKGVHRISLLLTVLIHLVILIIPLPKDITHVKKEFKQMDIPVQLKVKEVIIKKTPPPPPPPPPPLPKKEVSVASVPKPKPKPPKPKSLPGDRKKAVVAKKSEPYYPKQAINNGWSGTVILDVTIDKDGKVLDVAIYRSSGHDVLDETFIETIREDYMFKPKRLMGEDQKDLIRLKYTYDI